MRCELDREIFADLLSTVTQIIPARAIYPIHQNILLEVSGDRLAITGADGDTTVRREVVLEGKSEEGVVLVRGRELATLIQASSGSGVELLEDGNVLRIRSGRFTAALVRFPSEDFPQFPALPEGGELEFSLATLFDMFETCNFAVSKDEARTVMTGINWEISKTQSRMVATDSYRLVCVTRKVSSPGKAKLLLSPKVIGVLPREEDVVKVFFDPKMVGFQTRDMKIVTRMIQGPYPDYEKVIPKGYSNRAFVKQDDLMAALRRAMVLTVGIGKPVSLEFGSGQITVRAENPDLGKIEETVDCEYQGEGMRIWFNGAYLAEIMRYIGSEEVTIEISSPMSPVLFKPKEEEKKEREDLFILMPIRMD